MIELNSTHDAALRSWVDSANQPGCDFPIQSLPFGVFPRRIDGNFA
jgi:fumarylacetoacetase